MTGALTFLVISQVANLALPRYIGMITDEMTKKQWGKIDILVRDLLIMVCVCSIAAGIKGFLNSTTG